MVENVHEQRAELYGEPLVQTEILLDAEIEIANRWSGQYIETGVAVPGISAILVGPAKPGPLI